MIRRPPRSTHCISSAASDVYKRQVWPYYIFLINIHVQVIDVSWWWCWLGGRGGLQYIISSAVWNINLLSIFNKIIIIWSIFCLKNKVNCMNLIERRKSAIKLWILYKLLCSGKHMLVCLGGLIFKYWEAES